jgi:hypothetical protein
VRHDEISFIIEYFLPNGLTGLGIEPLVGHQITQAALFPACRQAGFRPFLAFIPPWREANKRNGQIIPPGLRDFTELQIYLPEADSA